MEKLTRRNFIETGALASLGAFAAMFSGCNGAVGESATKSAQVSRKKFKMKFAPRGLFRASTGKDPLKRLKWLSDNGFIAVEGVVFCKPSKVYKQEEMNQQIAIGEYAKALGLEMGCISSMNDKDFPIMTANQVPDKSKTIRDKKAVRDCLMRQMDNTFGVLERIKSKSFIIGPGIVDKELSAQKQYENVVENMSFCADYCKRAGFVAEIEPLNTTSHPNMYWRPRRARGKNSPRRKQSEFQAALRHFPRTDAGRQSRHSRRSVGLELHRVFPYRRCARPQRTGYGNYRLQESFEKNLGQGLSRNHRPRTRAKRQVSRRRQKAFANIFRPRFGRVVI